MWLWEVHQGQAAILRGSGDLLNVPVAGCCIRAVRCPCSVNNRDVINAAPGRGSGHWVRFPSIPRSAGMSHTVKIYDTCIGCTQCVRACPLDVLEMVPWDGCKAGQIASSPRLEDCIGCKRCETACPTDFLSVRVYLGDETSRSMGLAY